MTRKEMLKWIYENCNSRDNAKHYKIVKEKIGVKYYQELNIMQFLKIEYQNGDAYVFLSWLGKTYCEEFLK
jgi:hypothetical protein